MQRVNDRISVLESSINAKIEEIEEKEETKTGVDAKLRHKRYQLEQENITHETYSKRLNLPVHRLEEKVR